MRKSAVVQCPEHVFCEQAITKNVAHPFCIRQYSSFQDKYHLYFLFDLMPGGDLMDVLVGAMMSQGQYPWSGKASMERQRGKSSSEGGGESVNWRCPIILSISSAQRCELRDSQANLHVCSVAILLYMQVAEAKVIKRRVPQGGWQVGCLAPKVKMLQVGECPCFQFYHTSDVVWDLLLQAG
jgi:hypothetical protein